MPVSDQQDRSAEKRHPEERSLHPLPRGLVELYGLVAVLVVLIPEWLADGTISISQAAGPEFLPMRSRATGFEPSPYTKRAAGVPAPPPTNLRFGLFSGHDGSGLVDQQEDARATLHGWRFDRALPGARRQREGAGHHE